MKELFKIDTKDYNPEGKIFSRPSVRGIIVQDGKALLMHSKKYDYYKFPGGGIEGNESHAETLIREVAEESGYVVIPESIQEFGKVIRRNRDDYDENAIFEQENFYYFCEVKEERIKRNLDPYELEEGFVPVWIGLMEASRHNIHKRGASGGDEVMIQREAKAFDLSDAEIRKSERIKKENIFIDSLGDKDYRGMLEFVRETLCASDSEYNGAKMDIAYSRFDHTKRVLGWAKRLYDVSEYKNEIRYEDVMIATIFHDVGRTQAQIQHIPHAEAGVPITREYLSKAGFDGERIDYICELVGKHSDKFLMKNDDIDKGLLLLLEADLMDDMGALGVVMDCMITKSRNPQASFEDCLDHINRFTHRIMQTNPMVTAQAKKLWNQKTELVSEFTKALQNDIEL